MNTLYVQISFVQRQNKICSQYRICLETKQDMFLVSHLPSVFSWSPLLLSRPQQQGLPRQVSLGRCPQPLHLGLPSRCTRVSLAAAPRSPGHKPSYTPNIVSEIVSKSIHYFNKIFATNSKKRLFRCEKFSLIDLSPSFNPSLLLRFGHMLWSRLPNCSALPGLLDLFCFSSQLEMNYCQQYICRW